METAVVVGERRSACSIGQAIGHQLASSIVKSCLSVNATLRSDSGLMLLLFLVCRYHRSNRSVPLVLSQRIINAALTECSLLEL
mmetsp:Transcript_16635/g.24668  ORF Transcript_16635/g.24668 Transcript_16635/m.24668 type:complete len:84 (-) Transcript_16635:440-691(-)